MTAFALVSVNVGQPAPIGTYRGKTIVSGIRKSPVAGREIAVSLTNLAGDGQANLAVHGGPDKAVYAYPVDHLAPWAEELGASQPYPPGTFGENLTVAGWTEETVLVGDTWRWGDVVLQVCQPREPCFKLGMVVGPTVVKRMVANGRSGWYLRVLQPGTAPTSGMVDLIARPDRACTVEQAHRALTGKVTPEELALVLGTSALAERYRDMIEERFAAGPA